MKACPHCWKKIQDSAKKCRYCGEWLTASTSKENVKQIDKWLGGWLTLVGFWLFLTPIRILYVLYTTIIAQINDWTIIDLIDKNSPYYIQHYLPLITFEFVSNLFFILFSIYLVYLYANERKSFPRLYIAFLALNLFVMVIDYFRANSFPRLENIDYIEIIKSSISFAVRGGYISASTRVKNTFIKTSNILFDKWMKIVLWISGMIIIWIMLSINFDKLHSGRLPSNNNVIGTKTDHIQLSKYQHIYLRSDFLTEMSNVSELSSGASVWFHTSNGNVVLVIPEELTLEISKVYEDNNNDSAILDNLKEYYTKDIWITIKNQYVKNINWFKYYIFEGEAISEGSNIQYAIWLTTTELTALTIYVYWYDKSVSDDFRTFVNSVQGY